MIDPDGTEHRPSTYDSYPVIAEKNDRKVKLQFLGKQNKMLHEPLHEESFANCININHLFVHKISLQREDKGLRTEEHELEKELEVSQMKSEPEYLRDKDICETKDCYTHDLMNIEWDKNAEEMTDNCEITCNMPIKEKSKELLEKLVKENKTTFTLNTELAQDEDFISLEEHELTINTVNAYDLFKEFQNGKVIPITMDLIHKEQLADEVLSKVKKWVENKALPTNVILLPNTVLKNYANRFQELAIHPTSKLLCKIDNSH
jgi:hypothetical protein